MKTYEPLAVELVPGDTPPGFTSKPDVMWVKVKGGTAEQREHIINAAHTAAKETLGRMA